MQDEKQKEFKTKVEDQVSRLKQSCEKAQRRVEQLTEERASPMQDEVDGHRERVTALEVLFVMWSSASTCILCVSAILPSAHATVS